MLRAKCFWVTLVYCLRLCRFFSFGSGSTFHWVQTLHLLRFGWYITVGSEGLLKDYDLWV